MAADASTDIPVEREGIWREPLRDERRQKLRVVCLTTSSLDPFGSGCSLPRFAARLRLTDLGHGSRPAVVQGLEPRQTRLIHVLDQFHPGDLGLGIGSGVGFGSGIGLGRRKR